MSCKKKYLPFYMGRMKIKLDPMEKPTPEIEHEAISKERIVRFNLIIIRNFLLRHVTNSCPIGEFHTLTLVLWQLVDWLVRDL